MSYDALCGVERPAEVLRRAIAQRQLSGAYLLCGPPSVGKTSLALAFAQAAACKEPNGGHACGDCQSCRMAVAGNHPEIQLIAPAGDKTQIYQFWDRPNRPRGALEGTLNYAPSVGVKRVYIIERADTLTDQAANSLLKALEETPPYVLFILLASHASRMLPTILSRCQMVRLMPSPQHELADWLHRTRNLPMDRCLEVAAFAEGRTGAAITLAGSATLQQEIDDSVELVRSIVEGSALDALKLGEGLRRYASSLKLHSDGKDEPKAPQKNEDEDSDENSPVASTKEKAGRGSIAVALDRLSAVLRDLISLQLHGDQAVILHERHRAVLGGLAMRRGVDDWMLALKRLSQARVRVDQNASVGLLTDWVVMELVAA